VILSGQTIYRDHLGMITPFRLEARKSYRLTHKGWHGVKPLDVTLSGGLSVAGYDIHLAKGRVLSPHEFYLAHTVEHFNMPLDVLGVVHDKSTLARLGLAVQNTVIEPGWRGHLTLELTNHGMEVLLLKDDMPIAQVLFHRLDQPSVGYKGSYQDQENEPVGPR